MPFARWHDKLISDGSLNSTCSLKHFKVEKSFLLELNSR
jgi:hypothetical protein